MTDMLIIYKDPAQTEVASVIKLTSPSENKAIDATKGTLKGRSVEQMDDSVNHPSVEKAMVCFLSLHNMTR